MRLPLGPPPAKVNPAPAIPLALARLCVNCETIVAIQTTCWLCGSVMLVPLSVWLDRSPKE